MAVEQTTLEIVKAVLDSILVGPIVNNIMKRVEEKLRAEEEERRSEQAEPGAAGAAEPDPEYWAEKRSDGTLDAATVMGLLREGGWIKCFAESGRIWAFATGCALAAPVSRGAFQALIAAGEIRSDPRAARPRGGAWVG